MNEVSEGTNNGDNMQKITGVAAFPDKSTAEVNDEWISTESTSSIKKGNVYRIIHDKDGYTIIDSKNLLYSVDNEKFGLTQDEDEAKTETDIEKAEFVTIAGSVVSKDDDTSTIMIAPLPTVSSAEQRLLLMTTRARALNLRLVMIQAQQ